MRSFICKLVYWIMLKLYVFILWALLPLLTMGKGILIQNVVIFDGKSEKTVTGNVWIEDNAIRKVSAEPIVAGAEVEVIDGRGKFLMPGLIDAHWHAYLAANTMVDLLTAHASYTQLRAGEEAGKTLLRGFTTIRDAGGPVFGLKRAIDEGTLPGPRIYPSGAIISETGGHADFRMVYDIPEPFDCCGLTHTEKIGAAIIADGVDAVIVASRNNLRLGASQIKLMAGGGVSSLYDQLEDVQYFEDELHAAVMAAEDAGTYVMVHVYVPEAIRRAIRAGVKSIEHGQLIDEPTMKLIAEKGVWLSMQPFIGEGNNHYTNPVQQAKHELVVQGTDRAYQLAKKYGVKLAWGTDLLFSPANARNQNLNIEKMTRWFSNFEILKMITHDNAELLALSGRRNPYPGKLGVIDEAANIGQIPNLEKLMATIRSREISACLVLQAQSQLKALYKDNMDTIIGNCDSSLFLGGKEETTLKSWNSLLGKETIDLYNTSVTKGTQESHGQNFQKLGKDLMSVDELAVMDGGKCLLQIRGVRPFLSRKYDITKHPNYKYLSDFDEKNAFDIEKYLSTRLPVRPRELYPNYEITPEELAAQTSA